MTSATACKSDNSDAQKTVPDKNDAEQGPKRNDKTTELRWMKKWLIVSVACILITSVILTILCMKYPHALERSLSTPPASRIQRLSTEEEQTTSAGVAEDVPTSVSFVERSEWNAAPPAGPLTKLTPPVPYVIISHTATDSCHTRPVCTFHMRFMQTFQMESRGWSDIAYNFMAGGDGLVYVGRSWDYVGAHSFGFNNRSIGVTFVGTFNAVPPPEGQLDAVKKLLELGVQSGKLAADYKLLGHRQVLKTLSPGDALYGIIKTWPHWSSNVN